MRGAPVVYTVHYLLYMAIFLLLPLILMPRLKRLCTDKKFWGKL